MDRASTSWIQAATLAVSSLLLCNSASATELVAGNAVRLAAGTTLSSTLLMETEALATLRENARKSQVRRGDTRTRAKQLKIRHSDKPAMIEKMLELEALPLVKVSGKNRHRVYFGISFDGVLGFHGNF